MIPSRFGMPRQAERDGALDSRYYACERPKSGRGLPQSKTLRDCLNAPTSEGFGVRQSSAAFAPSETSALPPQSADF